MAGTMILLAAGISNRIFGFIPRVALPRLIGAEGVGLFQLGYPFLFAVLTLITGGIPLAVSKLISEAETDGDERRARSILKWSLAITASLSLIFTALCVVFAPWITGHLLTDRRVTYTFLCMSPIIPLASISAVLRGYFQGRQNMIPTAASQVTETLVRVVMVIAFAWFMRPYGVEYAAAGAMVGVMIGELCGLLLLCFYYTTHSPHRAARRGGAIREAIDGKAGGRRAEGGDGGETGGEKGTKAGGLKAIVNGRVKSLANLRRLLEIAIPVTGSKLAGSFSYLFESIAITQSLAMAGVATAVATAQYGMLTGMAMPVLYLPSALTFALAVSLVPSLSEAAARNNLRAIHMRLHQSLRLALVTGAPFAVVMLVLAEPLCHILFGDAEVGKMLKMMAPLALFIYLHAPLNAALQALDRAGIALVNTLISAAAKLGLIFWLASKPEWGIRGAVAAIIASYVLDTLLDWRSVSKAFKFHFPGGEFVKVGIAMAAMGAVCWFLMNSSWSASEWVKFAAAGLVGTCVYLWCILRLHLVEKEDFRRIPWIGKRL
jgi:stage V sporulation protein B